MILYHFTPMENVEAIQREGLRALPQVSMDIPTILGTCDKPAVHLTDIPTTKRRTPTLNGAISAPRHAGPYRQQAMADASSRPAAGPVHNPPAVA